MESEIINWLNGYSIKVGTIVIILAIIFFIGKFIYNGRKKYDSMLNGIVQKRVVKLKAEEEEKRKETETDRKINNLSVTVNSINDTMSKMQETMDRLSDNLSKSESSMRELENTIEKIRKDMTKNSSNIEILLDSDRENIRSEILHQYYKCTKYGKIDLYTLNVLEDKFKKYSVVENGNSFVENMMNELRMLPKVINYSHEDDDPIGYFVDHPEALEETSTVDDEEIG